MMSRLLEQTDTHDSIEPIALPPKTSSKHAPPFTTQKSVDEILDDLDKERKTKDEENSRPNVKEMIQRFNVPNEDNEVILRRADEKQHFIYENKLRHNSDDLNNLLEKLSEITVAPPMEPGVTSSLASPPIISDDDWLKLLPIRKRRMSDPDYDIPRPHRSLVIQPKIEDPENVIPATRFFGPVLESSDFQNISKSTTATSRINPSSDSLEVIEKSDQSTPTILENASYFDTPKHYYDQVIFVHPSWRPLENDSTESLSNEIYVDSLENSNELSTAF